MKIFFVAFLLSSFVLAAAAEKKKTLPVIDTEAKMKKEKLANEKLKALNIKDEEDCDEKAKKPVEIIPETISLGGNAGCTLPE